MSDLLKLAERCEAATGPDRELDEDIERATGRYAAFSYYTLGDDCQPDYVPTRFTASLDAAATLMDGAGVLITLSEIKGDGMPLCVIGNPGTAELFEAVANTMPLALCAAALRARTS